jgi:hypothetical protein
LDHFSAAGRSVEAFSGFGRLGAFDEIDAAEDVAGIAGAHQRLGRLGDGLAGDDGIAAVG